MTGLVEHVARALCLKQVLHNYRFDGQQREAGWLDGCVDAGWKNFEDDARTAIEAMSDGLTDSMAEVIAHHGRCCGGIAHTIWTEAIDVELKGPA